MRIGYLSDGDAEIKTIPTLLRRTSSPHSFVGPLKTALQISTRVDNVAAATRKGVVQLKSLGAEAIIVMLDRETSVNCPPLLAQTFRNALYQIYRNQFTFIDVVIKDQTFENWLIADLEAIDCQPGRFTLTQRTRRSIESGRADNIDAQRALKDAATKSVYSKLIDAQRIAKTADPARIAASSRSFRRLLRSSGDPTYATQSKIAAVIPLLDS
jgi:hypothetical protein